MRLFHKFFPVFFLAALFVFSAGCMTTQSPAPSVTSATTQATVDDAKLTETLAWLDTTAEQQRREWNIPGMAVAVVKDGKIVFMKGYGVKRAGTTDPVTTDTVFEMGSASKAFTAMTVAEQVDKGKMNWTDPVVRYVPSFQILNKNVTNEYSLTDSMSQRSGIPEQWGLDLGTLGYNRSEIVSALRYAEPKGTFRTSYAYQNLPWLAAAASVENVSGKSWDENVREGIFVPLNLTSGSTTYAGLSTSPDHVTLHRMVRLGQWYSRREPHRRQLDVQQLGNDHESCRWPEHERKGLCHLGRLPDGQRYLERETGCEQREPELHALPQGPDVGFLGFCPRGKRIL